MPSAFVLREAERERLAELVSACRLVTVTGPGGIGQTRLADETAGVVGGRLPGGVRRCELAASFPLVVALGSLSGPKSTKREGRGQTGSPST